MATTPLLPHSINQPVSLQLCSAGHGDKGSFTGAVFIFVVVVLQVEQLDTVRSKETTATSAAVSVNIEPERHTRKA